MNTDPDFLLFAQHGWADTNQEITKLAQALATPKTQIVTPNLGFLKTWLKIEPLIQKVEKIAQESIDKYPGVSLRIIGHSMGGLIWLEILNYHPEWWSKIHSLILIASPVGGSDLARIFDPFGIGIGIAKDLGKNRRPIAEKIAQHIPTLVIAGDVDNGSDGTITVETTKFAHSQFICLPEISHPQLKNHPSLIKIIQSFWIHPTISSCLEEDLTAQIIHRLRSVPGMTDAHRRDFEQAKIYLTFKNGMTIRTWKNPLQVNHIFLADEQGKCLYAGFIGWTHSEELEKVIEKIKEEYVILSHRA